jgi:GTP-binding protein Era
MIEKVKESIKDADVCCLVTEPVAVLSPLNQTLLAYASEKGRPTVVAVNKIDTAPRLDEAAVKGRYGISALTGQGCEALWDAVVALLPESHALFPEDIYTEHSTRFLASELVREVVFEKLHQELPYAAAVVIDEFKEKPEITVIKAAIVVEKDSQKAMVIGSRGGMIKEIGMEARRRIEDLLNGKVFLELFVRVEKNWTKDPKKVEEMGYG